MSETQICEAMRADWNRRALEDARYYVAFGRRNQDDAEFFATGLQLAGALAAELKRMPSFDRAEMQALEIGCGLGRLMKPMSRHFAAIHGIDVSDEMVRGARERLSDVPNARVHLGGGSDLSGFPDETFAFVYSFAVFQHIPSRDVVFRYLDEAGRVLKPGGIFRFQLNGLPETAARYDTWNGVRIAAGDIARFALDRGLQLLALDGIDTQYMWVTLQKPGFEARQAAGPLRIHRITKAFNSEPWVPARGRYASAALWVSGLPEGADINSIEARIGGAPARIVYLGPREYDALQHMNVRLPAGIEPGLHPIEISSNGGTHGCGTLRVMPAGPLVPRVLAVTDGIDLLSPARIVNRVVKIGIEEVPVPLEFTAMVSGVPVERVDLFCVDPVPPQFEVNFGLPQAIGPGRHQLEMRVGTRRLPPVSIEVA